MKKLNIAIDFDGTISSQGKFIAVDQIPYPPIEGAKEALTELSKYFRIIIYSCRAASAKGAKAIEAYMLQHELPFVSVTAIKPAALFYIDNLAIRFEGDWKQTLKQISSLDC